MTKTYLSNHTLEDIRYQARRLPMLPPQQDVTSVLELNRCDDKGRVAKKKILKHHRQFDIQPFLQWDFKVLPLLLGWLEFSAELDMNETIEMRKLTVVYEFIQALSELFVSTYSLQELSSLRMQADPALDSRIAEVEHRWLCSGDE